MRVALAFAVGLSVVAMTAETSFAQTTGPVIVIPSRPGVPIYINGIDASYGVVEGDWGLARSVHVVPTVTYAPVAYEEPSPVGHYYPSFGIQPGYGRKEIQPAARRRPLPRAESYSRVWGVESAPLPAQIDPPANPPAVIYAPQGRQRHHHLPH
jgi:hypothetical protein